MWIICSMMSMPMCLMYIKKSRVCVYIYIILFFSIFNNSIVIMMKKWEFRSKIKLSSFKLNFCRLL